MSEGWKQRYRSLEHFLISNPLSVDGILDDGWGEPFPVKGREIEAAVLFADITSFSERTLHLSSTETLIFVNNFFAWITAEGMKGRPGLVTQYVGDEMMVVFSKEFGSADPFLDAVHTARWFAERDAHAFCPHMGIASGIVTVGLVGTPMKYSCCVLGKAVTLASRCAAVRPAGLHSASVAFPSALSRSYTDKQLLPPVARPGRDGSTYEEPPAWEKVSQTVRMKNLPETDVTVLARLAIHYPQQSATDRAREALETLHAAGVYRPRQQKD